MSPKEVPKYIYEKYEFLGYSRILIETAFEICSNAENENLMIDTMMNLQKENEMLIDSAKNVQAGVIQDDDLEVTKAIMESLKTAQERNVFVETLNPIDRKRKVGVPTGLKNIGNTCYFNSLLQTYFMYPQFVKEILDFKEPKTIAIADSNLEKPRIIASIKLVKALQLLFGMMIFSKKKYVDPSVVLNSMVDDLGKIIPIGDQKDIGEFNLNFLARIEEGLLQQEAHIALMQIEEEKLPEGKFLSCSKSEKISLGSRINESDEKKKFIMTNDDHLVFKLFFGKIIRYMTYSEDGQQTEQSEEEPFNMIILDLKEKDLYSSWEESLFETIDDYKNKNGEITPAFKSSFIKSPPGTLFFQLQRVVFDKEKGVKKINDKFTFEKEIFIDRTLDENKVIFTEVRKEVQKLKQIVKSFEEAIRQIKNYNNSDINLLEILAQSQIFLISQKEKPMELEETLELIKPTYFGVENEKDINICVNLLENYKKSLETKLFGLEMRLTELNKQIEDSYIGLKKIKYRLLSILIHEGSAEYGHYYSYICDFQQNLWRKYNDTHISQVNEEEVFKEAIGGQNIINAYCLIYIHEDLTKSYEEILPLRLYSSFDNGQINDLYTKFLSETNIIKEIEIDNMKFLKEVEEYQIRNQIKTIFEDYHREFQYINEVERKIKEKQEKQENKKVSLTPTLNFCIFLRLHKGNKENKFDPLVNWNILNHCISMGCPELKSLENFVNFPPTWQEKFKEQIKKMNEMSKYKSVVLDIPMDQYMELLNEYNELTLLISISTYFLKKAVENNFKESLFAAIYLKKYLQGSKNQFFTKFNIEFFKILLLFICSKIHENLKEELLVEFKENCQFLNLILSHYIEENELKLQIKVWLSEILALADNYTKNLDFIQFFKDLLQELGKNKFSLEELGILEPKDFSMMLNQNAIENDAYKIDIMKEEDVLNNDFNINFKAFQMKYDKWCIAIRNINNHFKIKQIPLMKKELEDLGIF